MNKAETQLFKIIENNHFKVASLCSWSVEILVFILSTLSTKLLQKAEDCAVRSAREKCVDTALCRFNTFGLANNANGLAIDTD